MRSWVHGIEDLKVEAAATILGVVQRIVAAQTSGSACVP